MKNQIGASVMIHVLKRERDRGQAFPWADQRWADVDLAAAGVVSGDFYHLKVPVEVQRDEMAQGVLGGSMPNIPVNFKRSRSAIVPVVLGDLPPRRHHGEQDGPCQQQAQG